MNMAQACCSVAVSSVGGIARQYRVQILDEENNAWRKLDIFRSRRLAEARVAELEKEGLQARVVAYVICPTAN